MDKQLETYKDLEIIINQVRDTSDFGDENNPATFGWGFQIRQPRNNRLVFSVVVKCPYEGTDSDIDKLLHLGRNKVHSLIDKGETKTEKHCFTWDKENSVLMSIDCDEISPLSRL